MLLCTSTNRFIFGPFFVSSSDLRLVIVVGFSPVVGHYCFCSKKKKKKKKKKYTESLKLNLNILNDQNQILKRWIIETKLFLKSQV